MVISFSCRDSVHAFHFVVVGENVPSLMRLDSYKINFEKQLIWY